MHAVERIGELTYSDIIMGLRQQHKQETRAGAVAHNRRSGGVTIHDIRNRGARRWWNMRLNDKVREYNLH